MFVLHHKYLLTTLMLILVTMAGCTSPEEKQKQKEKSRLERSLMYGKKFYEEGDYRKAIYHFSNIIDNERNHRESCKYRGLAYFKLNTKEYEKRRIELGIAYIDLQLVIYHETENFELFNYLGLIDFEREQYENAAKWFKKASEVKPTDIDYHYYLSACLYRKENYQDSIDHLKTILELNPDHLKSLNALAWIFSTCNKDEFRNGEKAIEYSSKACKISDWKNPAYISTLAVANAEVGKFDQAQTYLRKTIPLIDKNEDKIESIHYLVDRQSMEDQLRFFIDHKAWRHTPEDPMRDLVKVGPSDPPQLEKIQQPIK